MLGFDPVTQRDEIRTRVGVQLQASNLPDRLSVFEALDLYASFYADPRDPDELIDLLGLTHRRDARYGKLSGGEKQRVSVGLALSASRRSPSWTSSPPAWTRTPAATCGR